MRPERKSLTKREKSGLIETESKRTNADEGGTTLMPSVNAPERSINTQSETPTTDSLTPFPNIDQVQSPSTNLIDDTTRQLKELMNSVVSVAPSEHNLFQTVNAAHASAGLAKQISGLLRLKLDIFKAYRE